MDRDQDYDIDNTTPFSGNAPTLFPVENTRYCPAGLVRGLGYDWVALDSAVNAMAPNGSTNQPIGLAWGWQALTVGTPLFAPPDADPSIRNVIVLLSDGLNTQDRWYGNGSTQSTQVDARMALVCSKAKAAGVLIYTVLVMSGNSTVLQNCASDAEKYFELDTAGEIVTAFNTIGTELANLHIAK